jgi:hypothetical protein
MYISINTLLISSDSDVYNINTTQKYNFHQPSSNLSPYQKGCWHKAFNSLPQSIKNLSDNPKQFKSAVKNYEYLHAHSFYSIDE